MPQPPCRTHDREYSGGKTAEFAHDWHQLMLVGDKPVILENSLGAWPIPGGRAAWIPAGTRHRINAIVKTRARTLYLRRDVVKGAPRSCAALEPTPLLRALIDHLAAGMTQGPGQKNRDARLFSVILDQLPQQRELPLFVPVLTHALARRAAGALDADPSDTPRFRDLAVAMGVSTRTIDRAFSADVSMTLGEWRRRSRLCRAIVLLAEGMAVKDVALEVGYETPSAFVAAFRKAVGTTPGRF